MVKVLHAVAGMNLGGTETYLINVYRHIDRKKVQFDFLTYYEKGEHGFYDQEIDTLGGKIHNIPKVTNSGVFKFVTALRRILREEKYTIVHAHTTHNIGLVMLAAKLEGVKLRIAHVHNTQVGGHITLGQRLYRSAMKFLINIYANKFCACSAKASEHLFSDENREKYYTYMPNAVDLKRFIPKKEQKAVDLRVDLDIPPDAKIIGHVGRYGKAKNHEFIIEMFHKLLKRHKDIYLILVGDGPTRHKIEERIHILGIEENVKVLGLRSDVDKLMSIMDVFILPSFYEGFGIVLLEAQASGLPCIVSENIQPEPDMQLGLLHWVDLSNIEVWLSTIEVNLNAKILDKARIQNAIEHSPSNIEKVVEKFYDLYDLHMNLRDICD